MIWWQRLRWLLWDVAFRCVFLCCIHVKLLLWLPFLSCCNDILSLFASLLYSSFWLWNDLYPVISVCTWYIWRMMELQLQLLMQRRWHRLAVSIPLFVSSRKRSDFCPQINSNSSCRILIWCSPVNDPGCKGLFRNCRSFSFHFQFSNESGKQTSGIENFIIFMKLTLQMTLRNRVCKSCSEHTSRRAKWVLFQSNINALRRVINNCVMNCATALRTKQSSSGYSDVLFW